MMIAFQQPDSKIVRVAVRLHSKGGVVVEMEPDANDWLVTKLTLYIVSGANVFGREQQKPFTLTKAMEKQIIASIRDGSFELAQVSFGDDEG